MTADNIINSTPEGHMPQTSNFARRLQRIRRSGGDRVINILRDTQSDADAKRQERLQTWLPTFGGDVWEEKLAQVRHKSEFLIEYAPIPESLDIAGGLPKFDNGIRLSAFKTTYCTGSALTHPGVAITRPWNHGDATRYKDNQDNYSVNCDKDRREFTVLDGVGGTDAGGYASRRMRDRLQLPNGGIIDDTRAIHAQLAAMPFTAATTIAGVELTADGELYPIWAGDARVIVINPDGTCAFRSKDDVHPHFAHDDQYQERFGHPMKNIIRNGVGLRGHDLEVNFGSVDEWSVARLQHKSLIVLATDGVIDNINTEQICAILHEARQWVPVERLAEFLGAHVYEMMLRRRFTDYDQEGEKAWAEDNFTIQVIRYDGTPAW